MEKYYIVSFSGGKDSTAMLLRLMELGEQIDEVLFCDTYKEFPAMYKHIEKVRDLVESKGIKFTTIKSEKDFDYYLLEHKPNRKKDKYSECSGYSWCSFCSRWCSQLLKIQVIKKYLKEKKNLIQYVGIAADETKRLEREIAKKDNKLFPLVEWGWTEQDCLNYCYEKGFDWDGLYTHFKRVSCWCCPLQSLEELRALRKHYPALWNELKELDKQTWRKFRKEATVAELEVRFDLEEAFAAEGKNIKSREFFKTLKEVLESGNNQS